MNEKLPLGPWTKVFEGKWSGYEISLQSNPDKLTLLTISEKPLEKQESTGAIVFFLNKYFTVEGDYSNLIKKLGGYAFIFEKKFPTFTTTFLSISTGPVYSTPDEIVENIEESNTKLEKELEKIDEMGRAHGIELTELKFVKDEVSDKLFSDPFSLFGMISTKEKITVQPMSVKTIVGPKIVLGKKIDGEIAEEEIQSFKSTVAIGERNSIKKIVKIMVENCVLGGVTGILFDEDNSFENMSMPNKNFNFKEYPGLQPIGMPIKTYRPGNISIDINLLDGDMFREILGIVKKEGNYKGKDASDLIGEVIEEHRGSFKSIADLEGKLLTVQDESKKFHIYRAIRWAIVLKETYPELFGGKTELKMLVSPYLRTMGTIIRVDVSKVSKNVKRALIYSVLMSLYAAYKEKQESQDLKVVLFLVNGEQYCSKKPETALEQAIIATLNAAPDYGIGYFLGAEHEIDLFPQIVEKANMKFDFVKEDETAVKELQERPYRIKVRTSLSG